ncbi:hypothetical protein J2Z23_002141 [Lederbergia galactosidilyticus]|uniref:cyclic-phosphate processing receiver domain-containing protein n=1 Tax=Lederbergia galactosidilytica TaxID=217031 RepID=UPI001DE20B1A|nr:hypothetical protein [Lederbergia galactosidilytica]
MLKVNDLIGLEQYLKIHDANKEIHGQSLLYWAVFNKNLEFSKIIIEMGADVNQKDHLRRSPLSISCFLGFTKLTNLLLENGAKIDGTCMERAYYGWNGNIQIETLDILQEKGWINLYLDGLRKAPKGFTVARNVEEALSIMQHNKIHILSLDHDLGMDEKGNLLQTGYDLVKIMCQRGLRANKIYLHTSNVVGREAMYETLRASQRRGFIDDDIKIYFTENSFTDC